MSLVARDKPSACSRPACATGLSGSTCFKASQVALRVGAIGAGSIARSTMVTITGTLRGDTFDLKLAWGAVSLDVTIACDLPTGRVTSTIPTPLNAVNDLPITLAARDGAQGSDPRAGITVTMSQRP